MVGIIDTGTSGIEAVGRWVEDVEACELAGDRDFRCLGTRERFFDGGVRWLTEGTEFLSFAEDLSASHDVEGERDKDAYPVHPSL